MFKSLAAAVAALLVTTAAASLSSPALAGPVYIFSTSSGAQPSNVGTITLTQVDSNSVDVDLTFITPNYGLVNTGGPHVTFGFNLAGALDTLDISFVTPVSGAFTSGSFSLDTAGAGGFDTVLDDSAGNGSGKGYYGRLSLSFPAPVAFRRTISTKQVRVSLSKPI